MQSHHSDAKPLDCEDVQRLAGRLVSLSRFIPRLAEKAGPIFTLLRKPKNFEWTEQCEVAFQSFKTFLSTPPILQRPDHQADLLLYLAVAESTISAIIIQEHQKMQTPVYFINRVLQDAEKRYQTIEKLALALVIAARRIILEGPNRVTLEQSLKFGFKVTNNQAEYEELLAGLRLAHDLGARRVSCNSDSKLMVEQLSGAYQTKDTLLQRYFHLATQQISSFDEFTIHHVPREQNARADPLSKLASTKRILPEDKDEARKVRLKSAKFVIIRDELFKCGLSTPLLKCLIAPQAAYVIEEIHRGICGMHFGARSMAIRVLRAGYYWPTLKSDCQAYMQKCKECQQFGNTHRQPPEALHQMMSPWPFA
uniref:Retrotransposable element Tf2 n=1 Tax=Cajanus cajan TaxID=3821 RepID=A0A151RSE6_CAJCA|nr:Retrotransposable element Tf2 [Cajanus cajan]